MHRPTSPTRLLPSLNSVGHSEQFNEMRELQQRMQQRRKDELLEAFLAGGPPPVESSSLSLSMGTAAELLLEHQHEAARMQQGGSTAMPTLDVTIPSFQQEATQVAVPVYNRASLRDAAPSWWQPPPPVRKAAEDFDTRHHERSERAHRLFASMQLDQTSRSKADAYDETIFNLYSTRYVEPMEPLAGGRSEACSRDKAFDLKETLGTAHAGRTPKTFATPSSSD